MTQTVDEVLIEPAQTRLDLREPPAPSRIPECPAACAQSAAAPKVPRVAIVHDWLRRLRGCRARCWSRSSRAFRMPTSSAWSTSWTSAHACRASA